ncbi:hypothetical protein POW16_12685 [Raoultella planticola]|uniref:hypothetical protein n=1 Tax=Raoultella planticola TaxID=575 RepID=UPI002FF6512E
MTDITELAQHMKAAAVQAKAATEDYVAHRMSITVCLEECKEFNDLSDGPDNILALVEALEKVQGMEAYWKTQCRGITDHCEELQARIAELESRTVTAAAADVLAERQRQVTAEGWTAERDDGYQNSELADAAACYAIHAHNQGFSTPAHWPWSQDWWKQTSPRRDLVKAGALILAEIERLDRAAGIKVEAE